MLNLSSLNDTLQYIPENGCAWVFQVSSMLRSICARACGFVVGLRHCVQHAQ